MKSFTKKKILRKTRSFHLKEWPPLKGMACTIEKWLLLT